MQRLINNKLRIVLRFLLGFLSKKTLSKHKPKIIVITGDNSSSLLRELIYSYVKSNHKVRRNLENTYSEFSIPLTVFGTLYYPKSIFSWLVVLIKTSFQYFYIKPYKHYLILQIHFIDKTIFEYWIKIINPNLLICTDEKQNITNNEVIISKDDLHKISTNVIPQKIIEKLTKLGVAKISNESINFDPPKTRIKLIPGKGKSIIVDATYFYYPVNINSVIELSESFPGSKYFFSSDEADYKQIPADYIKLDITKTKIKPESVVIIRGSKDKSESIIRSLALHDYEI